MLCSAQSAYVESEDRRVSSPEAWLKPAEAMEDAFSDLPEAIRNTLVVAQRCAFMAPKRKPILPSLAGDREGEAAQLKADAHAGLTAPAWRSEEHTSELQSLMRNSYAVFCLKKKKQKYQYTRIIHNKEQR